MTDHLTLLIAVVSLYTATCTASLTCDRRVQVSYLNGAVYLLAKAEHNSVRKPRDCSDILQMGHVKSGKYIIWPASRLMGNRSLEVYCDMKKEGGGWTVIQRRGDFGNPKDYFDKDWISYKKGFGNLEGEFWLGNDPISALTNQRQYTVRFYLKGKDDESAFAEYENFWIDDENNKYKLHITGYTGTAGDSLGRYHNNQKFTTKDQDNDNSKEGNCAAYFSGGWWYNDCHISNLNGLYLVGTKKSYGNGITWVTWKGDREFLASSEIRIRPKKFKLQ